MVPGLGRSMQLLWGEVNQFRGLALCVRDGFSVYRQRVYDSRPMQLLRGKVDQFRELAVYMHDGISTHRQPGYECGRCEVIVAVIIFMCLACAGNQIYRIHF